MATFVLVHGAWHGSWCWKRVRKALQAEGHDVFTPTLTGVGERMHLLSPDVDLETQILDVVNLLRWEELSDVVLCGHSYGGCVITGVADRLPERIRSLVYLDAFVLRDGEALLDILPDSRRKLLLDGANAVGQGWKTPPIPAAVFNVNAADRAWADAQFTMHPLACFQQPLWLAGGVDRIARITYVLATDYPQPSPFAPFYEAAKTKGWNALTIDSGHDVMLDRPAELKEMLVASSAG